jgi:hypothetical protein
MDVRVLRKSSENLYEMSKYDFRLIGQSEKLDVPIKSSNP